MHICLEHARIIACKRPYSTNMKFQVSVAKMKNNPFYPLVTMQIGCIPDFK